MSTKVLPVLAIVLVSMLLPAPLSASMSGEPEAGEVTITTPTTLRALPEGVGDIVQRPNSGTAPTGSNERGGWEQLMVFGMLFVAVGAVGFFAWRDIRRKKHRDSRTPTPSS